MSNAKSVDLFSQLSGLRLSDGSTAGERARRLTTPPEQPPMSSSSSAPSGSYDVMTGSSLVISRSGVAYSSGAPDQKQSTPVTRGAHDLGIKIGAAAATAAVELKRNPITSTSSSQQHNNNNSSSNNATASTTNSVTVGSDNTHQGGNLSLPKPRSVALTASHSPGPETRAPVIVQPSNSSRMNPKVLEFFNNAAVAGGKASSPVVPIAPQSALKESQVVALLTTSPPSNVKVSASNSVPNNNSTNSNTKMSTFKRDAAAKTSPPLSAVKVVTVPSHNHAAVTSGGTDAATKEKALAVNKFLVDALRGERIDNLHATKPFIRTLPTLAEGGRYIVVGDVHGCVDQLRALIEKVKYQNGRDCLIVLGDYVNKGPDSIGVVKACIEWEALGVLGNHDFTLLNCCAKQRRKPFTADDLRDPVKRLAQQFPLDCEYYLRGLPHILRMPKHNVLLVHAGINIQHSIENQNVMEIMHMRRLEKVEAADGHHHGGQGVKYMAIVKGQAGVPWGTLWEGPEQVVFGHDAYAGFQAHPKAVGIDTGCVYGDQLTCVVYSAEHPLGEYIDVPGLPVNTNECMGLPPPDSDIYEQHQEDLEKLIIRPTTRPTPAFSPSSYSPTGPNPVFLSAPLGSHSPFSTLAVGATPTTTRPSTRLSTPVTLNNTVFKAAANASAQEVQRATLLALAASKELRAVSVLIVLPTYERELDAMMEREADDGTAQQAFWTPFVRHMLSAALATPPEPIALPVLEPISSTGDTAAAAAQARKRPAHVEDVVTYALSVCDEMPAVKEAVRPQLESLATASDWSRAITKYVSVLLR